MQGDIPFELVVSAAVGIIIVYRPIAPKNLGVVFAEQAEAIAEQAEGLPGEIGSHAKPAGGLSALLVDKPLEGGQDSKAGKPLIPDSKLLFVHHLDLEALNAYG